MKFRALYESILDIESFSSAGKASCKCVFHDDNKPSALVDLNSGVFSCLAGCGTMSPLAFLAKLYQVSTREAYTILSDLVDNSAEPPEKEQFSKILLPNPELANIYERSVFNHQYIQEYCDSRGIDISVARSMGISYLEPENTAWNRPTICFPYFYNGKLVGLRYRDLGGEKSAAAGSFHTLYGIDDLDLTNKVAVILEGESDMLRAKSIIPNFSIIGTPGVEFRKEWARELYDMTKIILVPQADIASDSLIKACRSALDSRLVIAPLPWRRFQTGKDLCEWLSYNSDQAFITHIEEHVDFKSIRVFTGGELESTAQHLERIPFINNLLYQNQICIIGGPPKNYKTWIVLNMVKAMLTDEPFLDIAEFATKREKTPKILFIEEEGDFKDLYSRAVTVLRDTSWKQDTFWGHRLGIKLDEEAGFQFLSDKIREKKIDLLILDPYQRLHNAEEKSESDTRIFWDNIHALLKRFPTLSIIILHHFTKTGRTEDTWNALRGSTRMAGEADLGIFVQKVDKRGKSYINMRIEGRTFTGFESYDPSQGIALFFDKTDASISVTEVKLPEQKIKLENTAGYVQIMDLLRQNGRMTVQEVINTTGKTRKTIYNWLAAAGERITNTQGVLEIAPPKEIPEPNDTEVPSV